MNQRASSRAQWILELSDAIESAQQLAWHLRTVASSSVEARELYGRLEAIRLEVLSMRNSPGGDGGFDGLHWLTDIRLVGDS